VSRDYEHEKWIPWYVDDTEGWLELSLAARGAAEGIARKMNGNGEIFLRRGLSGLASKLGRPWEECESAVAELIAKGRVVWDGSRFVLSDPEYTARKRKGSADRMREHRAKKIPCIGNGDACDVTSVTTVTDHPVTHVTPVLVSSNLISSGYGSGSEIASQPAWWDGVCDLIEQNHGVTLNRGGSWLGYWGHRVDKGKAPNQADALSWLTRVDVAEARKAREEARRRDDSDQKRTAAFVAQRSGPEVKPQNSRKAFAERDEWERTAGPPDPETAARMRALLGKVGT
jgi:hypothetical protein